jgi:serine/threonine protein kinase
MTTPTPLRPDDPDRLGRYQLRGRLGAGGMGVVYLGEREDGRQVAIKVIRPEFAADPEHLARFRREAEFAHRVAQGLVARVIDADFDGHQPYLVTEYVAGSSLDTWVRENGPLADSNLEAVALGVAAALAAIHKAGLVHRDLKPGNVLLSYFGLRVIDFGIARALDEDTKLTASRVQVGTPAFMAPEQFNGSEATPETDVFAWGGLVIFAATGRLPFGETGDRNALMYNVVHREPDLSALRPPLRELVASAMVKLPAHRPSALDLMLQLLGQGRAMLKDPQAEAARRVRQSWESLMPAEGQAEQPWPGGNVGDPQPVGSQRAVDPILHGPWPEVPTEREARDTLLKRARRRLLLHHSFFKGDLEIADSSELWLYEQWIEEQRQEEWQRPLPGKVAKFSYPEYSGPISHLASPMPVAWSDQRWQGLRRDSIKVSQCDCVNGKVRCPTCEGYGVVACPDRQVCPACGDGEYDSCHVCQGERSIACRICQGRGSRPCPQQACIGGLVRCPQCEGHLRYTEYQIGMIEQTLHATPEPPSGSYRLVVEMPDRFDLEQIPTRYRNVIGGHPRTQPAPADLCRRLLVFVMPRFEVMYHDGIAPRTAVLYGDRPFREVHFVDEQSFQLKLLRVRQVFSRLWIRLQAGKQVWEQIPQRLRVGLALIFGLLGVAVSLYLLLPRG